MGVCKFCRARECVRRSHRSEKVQLQKSESQVVKRYRLDLSIVRQFAPERIVFRNELLAYAEQTNRRMIECLKTIFFSGDPAILGAADTGSLFEDDDNLCS